MHIKFLNHGAGSAMAAADYLSQDSDHKGDIRPGIEVLRGDLYMTAYVADSLDFANRYSSSVISFHPEDEPTPEQLDEILDEFEKTAFSGLDEDQYSWSAVKHDQADGGCHIHIIAARAELTTGKHMNIAPPGWQKTFDPLRDYFNEKYGWVSPDIDAHPENARLVQPGHTAYPDVREALASGTEDPRQIITEHIMFGIANGLIETRDDLIQYLKDEGLEVPRIGKDYITVMDPALEKNNRWRFKGVLFDDKFTNERALQAEAARDAERAAKPDEKAARRLYGKLEEARRKRAEYNKKRYQQRSQGLEQGVDRDAEDEIQHDKNSRPSLGDSVADPGTGDSDNLGRDQVADERPGESPDRESPARRRSQPGEGMARPEPRPNRELRGASVHPNRRKRTGIYQRLSGYQALKNEYANALFNKPVHFESLKYVDRERGMIRFDNGGLLTVTDTHVSASNMSNKQAATNVIKSALAKGWEGVKFTGSDEFIAEATRQALANDLPVTAKDKHQQKIIEEVTREYNEQQRINAARTVVDEAIKSAAESSRRYVEETKQSRGRPAEIDNGLQRLDQGVARMRENNNLELDRFKTDINLVEYLASQGYELDRYESSKNSMIMRDGHDKIIVSTSDQGHGIYFNVHDDRDNGTIIDFVQNHQNKNLGQVRKELRPWIGQRELIDVPRYEKPKHITSDRNKPLKAYIKAQEGRNDYLASRGIDTVQNDPRFQNIKTFTDGSAIFPHYDADGFSGYERKGPDYTGFSSGGEKRLWHSLNVREADRIIITETAIDALSHAELKWDNDAAYMSFGGSMSPEQEEYLAQVIKEANQRGAVIVAATDNDEAGQKFADFIEQLSDRFERDTPEQPGRDWNDELKHDQQVRADRHHQPSR